MSVPSYDQQNVTIFWDFETTQISAASARIPIHELIQNLRAAVRPFGPIKAFRAYWDFVCQSSRLPNIRSELSSLSSSGLTLIDCPGNGRKDHAVKILLVDLIAQAWDTLPPHTFVVITADRDVAYGISTLRMRGYRVVVISPSTTHQDLSAQASVHLELTRAILGLNQDSRDAEDLVDKSSTPSEPFAQRSATTTCRRRDSAFSAYDAHKFGILGGMEDTPATPDVARGSFGLGDGPLFPRSQSRAEAQQQSRADSAPPNVFSTGRPLPAYGGFEEHVSSTRQFSKGKERAFPTSEPEDIGPYSATGLLSHTPYSGSIFEPFGEKRQPFQTAFSFSQPQNKPQVTRSSSSSTSSVSRSSHFSFVPYPEHHAEISTAPTSADTFPSTHNQQSLQKEEIMIEVNEPTKNLPPNPPQTEIAATALVGSSIEATATQTPTAPQVKASAIFEEPSIPIVVTPVPAGKSVTPPTTTQKKQAANPVIPPKFSPTKIASSSKQTGPAPMSGLRPTVPPAFQLLVDVLRKEGGALSKSSLGGALLHLDPKAYKKSGHSKLTALVSAASQAGIIESRLDSRGKAGYGLRSSYA